MYKRDEEEYKKSHLSWDEKEWENIIRKGDIYLFIISLLKIGIRIDWCQKFNIHKKRIWNFD